MGFPASDVLKSLGMSPANPQEKPPRFPAPHMSIRASRVRRQAGAGKREQGTRNQKPGTRRGEHAVANAGTRTTAEALRRMRGGSGRQGALALGLPAAPIHLSKSTPTRSRFYNYTTYAGDVKEDPPRKPGPPATAWARVARPFAQRKTVRLPGYRGRSRADVLRVLCSRGFAGLIGRLWGSGPTPLPANPGRRRHSMAPAARGPWHPADT